MYAYIMGKDSITLTNFVTGNSVTVFEGDTRFESFKEKIVASDFESAEFLADTKKAIDKFITRLDATDTCFSIFINDGTAMWSWADGEDLYPLHPTLIDRILTMQEKNVPVQPLVNFMGHLMDNPSKQSIEELYLFLEHSNLPITEDGYFIAYKIVREDYKDIYTGKFDNSVGQTVYMPRHLVDDRRENTCSQGLHFCSKGYLPSYSSHNRDIDRCMLLKINPADVVSIPRDYNNAKGRTMAYEVVGEVTDGSWRVTLSNNDYTDQPVVADDGSEIDEDESSDFIDDEDEVVVSSGMEEVFYDEFGADYNREDGEFHVYNIGTGEPASKNTVVAYLRDNCDCTRQESRDFYDEVVANG